MSLIQVSDLTFAYEGSYDNIFENVSFSIDTDWKLGFIGRNGKGKTTFLRKLKNETNKATIIIVAQRISTVMNADQIIVLDNGNIELSGDKLEVYKEEKKLKKIGLDLPFIST